MYNEIKTSIFLKKVLAVHVNILIHSDCFLGLPPTIIENNNKNNNNKTKQCLCCKN